MRALQQRVQNLELELNAIRALGKNSTPDSHSIPSAQPAPAGQQAPGEERAIDEPRSSSLSDSSCDRGEGSGDYFDLSWDQGTGLISPAESFQFDPFDAFSTPVAELLTSENSTNKDWLLPDPTATQALHKGPDDLYFERADPVLLLHHRRLYASWARSSVKTEAQRALQQALWTLASAQSPRSSHTSPAMYSQTRSALTAWQNTGHSGRDPVDPAWIQAHLLMAIYEALCVGIQQAGMTVAYCLRLMQVHQWHKLDSEDSFMASVDSAIVVEEKRRTFWTAFALDRFISLSCKLPVTLDDGVIATRLPASEQDFQQLDMIFTAPMPLISEAIECPDSTQYSPLAEMAIQALIAGRTHAQLQRYRSFDTSSQESDRPRQRHLSLQDIVFARADRARAHEGELGPMGIFNAMLAHMNVLGLWLSASREEQPGLQALATTAAQEIISQSRSLVEWSYLKLHPFTPLPLFVCAEFFRNRSSTGPDTSTNLADVLVLLQHIGQFNTVAKNFVQY